MINPPVDDAEVLRIMVDGGERLCDHAIDKWIANAYEMDEATRQEYIARWGEIKRRIRPLAHRIRE